MALTRIISEIIQDNTVQDTDISASFQASISGSFGNQRVGTTDDVQFNHITASGNISSSGTVIADNFQSTGGSVDGISFTDDLNITGNITASGAISSSVGSFTTVDIDGGTITGITDLTVADGGTGVSTLTDGGVLLGSGTSGITAMSVLADSEMIVGDGSTDPVAESGATLRTSIGVGTTDDVQFTNITGSEISSSTALFTTATIDNIGAFKATGAIDFDNQNMTNVDIDSGVITGITDLTVADGGTGVSTLTDGGVLLGSGAGAITAMAVLTDGQMIVGDGSTDPVAESGATLRTSIGVGTTNDVKFANITGSNNISASGNLSITGNVDVDGTSNFAGDVTLQNDLVVTGRIDAEEIHTTFISSSIAQATGSNIFGDNTSDSHQFTGSVDISGSLKVSDGNVVVSDTLTATNIGAFTAAGAIDFDNQNMTNVDIDSGVITGITDLTVADGGTGVSTLTDGGVLLGSGTSAITAMAVLTDGQMIVGDGTTDPVAESGATLRTSIGVGTTDDVQFTNITGSEVSSSTALFTTATIDKIGGAIDFNNENMTNVDIDSGTITGITDLTVADGGTGVSTLTDGGVLLGSGTSAITAMAVLTDGQMIVGDGTTDPVAESGATLRTSIGVGTTNDVKFANITGSGNISGSFLSTGSFGAGYFDNKVGIGVTSPAGPTNTVLDINGIINVRGLIIAGYADGANANAYMGLGTSFGQLAANEAGIINNHSTGDVIFGTNGTERVTIDGATGNVGIGVTDPDNKLEIVGGSDAPLTLKTADTRNGIFLKKPGSDDIYGSVLLLADDTLRFGTQNVYNMMLLQNGSIMSAHASGATSNTAFGEDAGIALASGGNYNTLFGHGAGQLITTADQNVLIGYQAGDAIVDGGHFNIAMGANALGSLTSGDENIAIGDSAGVNMTGTSRCVLVGSGAGLDINHDDAQGTVAVGWQAGANITSGQHNTFIGYEAGKLELTGDNNIAIGYAAFDETSNASSENVYIGVGAGGGNDGAASHNNVGVGRDALAGAMDGAQNNVAVGRKAGHAVTEGDNNTFIGAESGGHDVNITTGDYNTFLGTLTDGSGADAQAQIAIGYNVSCTGNATVTIGNSGDTASLGLDGSDTSWAAASSDERYKENITTSTAGLSFINDLRPVTYNWKKAKDVPSDMPLYEEGSDKAVLGNEYGETLHGFIAQEVKAVIDGHSEIKEGFKMWKLRDDDVQTVADGNLIPMLTKAVQELSSQVTELKKEIEELKS